MNTIDLIRLAERGAEADRLWAMVLLLAIKDGATRVWYDPARGESQLGYEISGVAYDMVPPPLDLQALLLRAVAALLRRRSVWNLIGRLLGGHREPPTGSFLARVGTREVVVSGALDPTGSRVVLLLSPDPQAARAAWDGLQVVLENEKAAWGADVTPGDTEPGTPDPAGG